MSNELTKKDWKLFREKLGTWQENYIYQLAINNNSYSINKSSMVQEKINDEENYYEKMLFILLLSYENMKVTKPNINEYQDI